MNIHPLVKKFISETPAELPKVCINYIAKIPSYYFNVRFCRPSRTHIVFTKRCNLKCRHCDIWKANNDKTELTTEEWKKVISKLAGWIVPRLFRWRTFYEKGFY